MCDSSRLSKPRQPPSTARQRRPAAVETAFIAVSLPPPPPPSPVERNPMVFEEEEYFEFEFDCPHDHDISLEMNGTCVLNQLAHSSHPTNFEPLIPDLTSAVSNSSSVAAISTMVRNIATCSNSSLSSSSSSGAFHLPSVPANSPSSSAFLLGPKPQSSSVSTMTVSTITTTTTSTAPICRHASSNSRKMSSSSAGSAVSPGTSFEIHPRISNHLHSMHQHNVDILEHIHPQPHHNHASPPTSFYQQKYRHFFVPPSALNFSGTPITASNLNRMSLFNACGRMHQRSASSSSVCNSASQSTSSTECTTHTSSMGTSPITTTFIQPSQQRMATTTNIQQSTTLRESHSQLTPPQPKSTFSGKLVKVAQSAFLNAKQSKSSSMQR